MSDQTQWGGPQEPPQPKAQPPRVPPLPVDPGISRQRPDAQSAPQPAGNPPQYPQYSQPPQFVTVPFKDTSSTNAVVGLIAGIVALLFCWIPFIGIVSWLIGGLGLLFSVLGYRQNNASRVMAIVAIILNAVALVVCCIYLLLFVAAIAGTGTSSTSP